MKKKYSSVSTAEKAAALLNFVEEHKGRNPVLLDLSGQNAFTEALLVVTAQSVRHAQSMAEGLADLCKKENFEFLRMEGKQGGQWVLLDLNDVVINIFQESVRDLYRLESLWADASPAAARAGDASSTEDEDA